MTKFIKSVMDFSVYYHTFYMMSVTCLVREVMISNLIGDIMHITEPLYILSKH